MSDNTVVHTLLATALHQAADVVRSRLERDVTVAPAEVPASTSLLRFDLNFTTGGKLTWHISNEDATGFSDLLIGGAGDRSAMLTEMHLDALTVAFGDMLSRGVEGIMSGVTTTLEAGELDVGMEEALPPMENGGVESILALEIAGFGSIVVVQQADPMLAHSLQLNASPEVAAAAPAVEAPQPAVAAPAAAAPAEAAEATEAPAAAEAQAPAEQPVPDNVIALPAMAEAAVDAGDEQDLDLLMNVPLPLTVELGRTQRTIRELVELNVGSIIELSKLAGDPLDIMVNERVIARGEVVVIDEEFGIRVTEIVSPQQRLSDVG